MLFNIRLKDSTPCVGIFEIIDDKIGTMVEPVENLKPVNGVIDGGVMFHRDLVRQMLNSGQLSSNTEKFIILIFIEYFLEEEFAII